MTMRLTSPRTTAIGHTEPPRPIETSPITPLCSSTYTPSPSFGRMPSKGLIIAASGIRRRRAGDGMDEVGDVLQYVRVRAQHGVAQAGDDHAVAEIVVDDGVDDPARILDALGEVTGVADVDDLIVLAVDQQHRRIGAIHPEHRLGLRKLLRRAEDD